MEGRKINLEKISIKKGNDCINFFFRAGSVGDRGVVAQIFQNEDYNLEFCRQGQILSAYYSQLSVKQRPLIVDCGANIGASVCYFHLVFPKSFIFAIEPEPSNYDLLNLNTAHIQEKKNVLAAIGSAEGESLLYDPGESDWGFRTSSNIRDDKTRGLITKVIAPNSILSEAPLQDFIPFIFKADIEGAEADLFEKNVEWMEHFPAIIIELHDWMLPFSGSSKNFFKALVNFDFDFVHRGENIFLFNRKILKSFDI